LEEKDIDSPDHGPMPIVVLNKLIPCFSLNTCSSVANHILEKEFSSMRGDILEKEFSSTRGNILGQWFWSKPIK
jgi:hypothetical protein